MNYQKPKRSREYLTKDEVEQLLKAAKDGATRNPIRDACLLTLLYHHALRVSELCNLRLSDITLDGEPSIYVRHQKGEERSVHPLYKSDVAALRKWLTIRQDLELDHDYLFCSEQRSKINRATINLIMTTVARKAGLEHLRPHPHSLRHACGYHLLNETKDLWAVQDYLGHKFLQSTVRYTKLTPGRFKDFAKLF
jgi:site-specific recombinase XerD